MKSALLVALIVIASVVAGASKPNIVFILADDLGWADTAVYGSRFYETPNIDRLAAEGMRFTSFHASPNCQPTRAALMTGQYSPHTGVYTVGNVGRFDSSKRPLKPVPNVTQLPLDKVTLAQALQSAGYATGMFGKWHLGEDAAHHPGQRGFAEAMTISTDGHFNFTTDPATNYTAGQYDADFLTDRAVDFIRRHKAQPFFLYLPHFVVHAPHQAKADQIARFKPKTGTGGQQNPTYAAMIASLDDSIGRVMQTLHELGLATNTVLIFSSDNGGVGGYEREGLGISGVTDNAPLRHGKGSLYEGGTRVPFIVRWPGRITAGASCAVPAMHVDLFPTFLEIAGGARPKDQPLDGQSLMPWLLDAATNVVHDAIYQHFPGYLGANAQRDTWRTTPAGSIQSGDWKLLEFFEDGRLELYNLKDDLGETNNLAAKLPDKVKELHAQLVGWRAEINAPMPTARKAGRTANQIAK